MILWLLLITSIIRGEPDVVVMGFYTEAACEKELAKEKKRDDRAMYCQEVKLLP